MHFTNFAAPCGRLFERSCGHFGSQQVSYRRNRRGLAICKKRFQKCGVSSLFLINISSYLLSDSTCNTTYKSEFSKSLIPLFHQFFRRHLIIFLNKSKYHLFHLLRNIQNIINTNRFWFFNHLFDHT